MRTLSTITVARTVICCAMVGISLSVQMYALPAADTLEQTAAAISDAKTLEYNSTISTFVNGLRTTYYVHGVVQKPDSVRITLSQKSLDDVNAVLLIGNGTGLYEYDPQSNSYSVSAPIKRKITFTGLDFKQIAELLSPVRQFLSSNPYQSVMKTDRNATLTLTHNTDIDGAILLTSHVSNSVDEEYRHKLWIDLDSGLPKRCADTHVEDGVEAESYREDFTKYILDPTVTDGQFEWSTPANAQAVKASGKPGEPDQQGAPGSSKPSSNLGAPIYQISCGTEPQTDDGEQLFHGGSSATLEGKVDISGIDSPAPPEAYQTERWGTFYYTLGGLRPGNSYNVRLHMSEFTWRYANQRKFNVMINGKYVLNDFDIFAEVHAQHKAVAKSFPIVANTRGQIVIGFIPGSVDYPVCSVIEVMN